VNNVININIIIILINIIILISEFYILEYIHLLNWNIDIKEFEIDI